MQTLNDETLDQEMFQAVDRNHRRAVERERGQERKGEAMPVWACLIWVAIMAAMAAACFLYAAS